eukprot:9021215-Alexandrium_andersonii.AAC.1
MPDARDAFLRCDVAKLKAALFSVSVPPPGYEPRQCVEHVQMQQSIDQELGQHVCCLLYTSPSPRD